jgi:hypothetical protein
MRSNLQASGKSKGILCNEALSNFGLTNLQAKDKGYHPI